jgi:monoamine oxidase
MFEPARTDIAIVGGGISGLYAAWRLTTERRARQVALFESSRKWGGRIDTTAVPPLGPGAAVELGPMRFTPSMRIVSGLLNLLNLDKEKFPGIDMRQLHVRGVDAVPGDPARFPYRLAEGESSNPIQLAKSVVQKFVPDAFELKPDQWESAIRTAKFGGRPVYEWGFWNIAEAVASDEAYDYLNTAFGLQSAMSNVNAAMAVHAIAVPLEDYINNAVYRPTGGWGGVVRALLTGFETEPGVRTALEYRLIGLSKLESGFRLRFETPEGERTIDAGQVILAMPKRSLELVDFEALAPRARLRRLLNSVMGVPAFKLCLGYEEPWWQKLKGWSSGYSITDMPVRQVFYGIGVGGSADQNSRILMASYCDLESTDFWSGLAQMGDGHTLVDSPVNGRHAGLVAAANRQLQTLLTGGQGEIPPPAWLGFADWSQDPFGGGWHEWRPGVDVLAAIPRMRQPFGDDIPVYVCGEAYSFFQGWIEGALMSAERLLENEFQLSRPDWIPTAYPLGP